MNNIELHFTDGYNYWKWDYHHAGFDIVANRILEVVADYYLDVHKHFDDDLEDSDDGLVNNFVAHRNDDIQECFWVTGHSMGAGVSNLVAASLIYGYEYTGADGKYRQIGGDRDNVYCYTFASPNTFYYTDSTYERESYAIPGKKVKGRYVDPKGVNYRSIFNIVNDDDFVPKLPMEECEWTKYGRVAGLSINEQVYSNRKKLGINEFSGSNYFLGNFLYSYKGNRVNPASISEAFSSIFSDKSNMRSESYTFNNEFDIQLTIGMGKDIDKGLFRWTLPFQSNVLLNKPLPYREYKVYQQRMYPQYLFASVGEMMHGYSDYENENGIRDEVSGNIIKFFTISIPKKLYNARKSFFSIVPLNLRALYIVHPHYVESYYTLTKLINTTDFK